MHAVTDKLPIPDGTAERIPFEELGMLVNMYFKALAPHLETVVAARDELGRLTGDLILSRNIDKSRARPSLQDLGVAYKNAESACQSFIRQAAVLSEEYL